jgi:glycogen phosphorylase
LHLDSDDLPVRAGPAIEETLHEDDVLGLRAAILDKLAYAVGKRRAVATGRDWFIATALAVRDRLVDGWISSIERSYRNGEKRVYYLSLEFLIGRLLLENLNNLGLAGTVRAALAGLDVDLETVCRFEPDAAIGNGGLGRLAACFMESMASLGIPAHGYGIRYDHGLFRQVITDGWQHEYPEQWLALGNPWEFARPEVYYEIGFGGRVAPVAPDSLKQIWTPGEIVEAVAYDTPMVGWRGTWVNTLRLWSARPADPLMLEAFHLGDHVGALNERSRAEAISKVLYPSDATAAGQELRLRQEYFFAAASLQDLVRRHLKAFGDLATLSDKVAIQLNDTHPAIAIAEMMRILIDLHDLSWEDAWRTTSSVFCYTNHTLLPEALETWPVGLLERLLPRHMQIIYLINAAHLDAVRAARPGDNDLLGRVSLVDEGAGRRVRMGTLAFVGSRRVNGVSALHTELMRQTVFQDLHSLMPDRIVNKTNGITFRRWLHQANPGLTRLLVEAVGPQILTDAASLAQADHLADDAGFRDRFAAMRAANKRALARLVQERLEIRIDPAALFDVHVKRIHEYKRQLLNILETIAAYNAIRANPTIDWVPRVKLFAGKAAPSYTRAKLIIKLAHDVARTVNADPLVRGKLKIAFLANYGVSLAEAIIPAADLSEQISTAGMEASGTGNMKLALNGALTIGTLDGANIEMADHIGQENMFIFGLTAQQVEIRRAQGLDASPEITLSPRLADVLSAIETGVFSPDEPGRYAALANDLRHHDWFMVCADFEAYCDTQHHVARLWKDPKAWWKRAVHNTARIGWFSSDRTIGEYAAEVWQVPTEQIR